MPFEIKVGDIATVVRLSQQIEEFYQPHAASEYEKRLRGTPHLILIAYAADQPIGFKVGYERDGFFYSWMGAVVKRWRRKGVAKALADQQENWARQQGYPSVTFKTRNRLKAMLLFALQNGFNIIEVEPRDEIGEYRILLRKDL